MSIYKVELIFLNFIFVLALFVIIITKAGLSHSKKDSIEVINPTHFSITITLFFRHFHVGKVKIQKTVLAHS